jgi:8-oxo-dGTP pyrophosphatase MutT (NUDIX family)
MRITIPFCGAFTPRTPRDVACVERVSRLIAERADAFSRDPAHGHVTGSAVVLNADLSAMVMTWHAKLGRWLQLGGHCDGLRDPLFVAQKEAYEESGLTAIRPLSPDILDIDIHAIPASSREPEHLHYDLRYLFMGDSSEPLVVTAESKALRWVPLADLEQVTEDPSVLRLRTAVRHWQTR